MTRLRATLLATAALTAALALPASAAAPADVAVSRGDVCVYVVQDGQPKGYCLRV